MCLGRLGYTYRGGCTDQTFTSNNCPSLCHRDPLGQQPYDRSTNINPCGTPGFFSTTFCCDTLAAGTIEKSCCWSNFTYTGSGSAFRPGYDALISSAS
ncbi:hypothetical protein Egran_03285, partial [Elaphomyces granulatus]